MAASITILQAFGSSREVGNMAVNKPLVDKKYFTVAEANATLPLVKAIVRDIAELARDLQERQERLTRVKPAPRGGVLEAHQEKLQQAQADFERDQERLMEYKQERKDLGVELKDYFTGLID